MALIKITCNNCKKSYKVSRTPELPGDVTSIECNYCPDCEHEMDDEYKEEYIREVEINEVPLDKKQINMFDGYEV